MLLAIYTTQVKTRVKKRFFEKIKKLGNEKKKWFQRDSKQDPPNQLQPKVNASIHWTTSLNAEVEFTRGTYSFSMVIGSFQE